MASQGRTERPSMSAPSAAPVVFPLIIKHRLDFRIDPSRTALQHLQNERALVRDTWGVKPAQGLEPRAGDLVVEKMSMSAWETSRLESYLNHGGRDTIINCGSWTNMSVEHTARTGADKGFHMIVPEDACSTMNADWHLASINYAMQNVTTVTRTDAVITALS
ncbi:cysteine hydrolase [Mesorhizobium sp. NBSH29]|uniref:cysteine hydrolase n=1 Tax=Mesorhizobium sp. NBSH29 TaxID=2654249 RepID=UPI0021560558|nr:cysteine hydrolase [Mesorhizobium sp. NBSH29]